MKLRIGDKVSRDDLSQYVGAGGDGCFLHRQNEVVAIAMDPEKNPEAPAILLVGKGPRKEKYAQVLLDSSTSVPTFVKKAVNQWEYFGNFKAEKLSHDKELIRTHSSRSGRNDIWGVMFLVIQS